MQMGRNRLEAFSDGVLAIAITIMVFGLKVPDKPTFNALATVLPSLISYVLSFLYLAIYWNNHHHLLHMVKTVNGNILWANMFLLFCLSLFPFVTQWMGENFDSVVPAIFMVLCCWLRSFRIGSFKLQLSSRKGKNQYLSLH